MCAGIGSNYRAAVDGSLDAEGSGYLPNRLADSHLKFQFVGVQSLFGSLMGRSGVPSLDGSAAEGVAANTDLAAGSTDDEVLGELQALLTSHAREVMFRDSIPNPLPAV